LQTAAIELVSATAVPPKTIATVVVRPTTTKNRFNMIASLRLIPLDIFSPSYGRVNGGSG